VRRVLFSVCVGGYDRVPPLRRMPAFDRCIMVTDDPLLACDGWERLVVPREADPVLQSRRLKLCPHHLIEAEVFVYMDANHEAKQDLGALVWGTFTGGFTAVEHPSRGCLYDEAEAIISLKRGDPAKVRAQVAAYRTEGMPAGAGLFSNGFFIRDRSFDGFCERWFAELAQHSPRDQLSLPYLVWKYRPQMTVIPWTTRQHYLRMHPHQGKGGPGQVWYFVPGAGDKNLGAALNRHCEIVPHEDDWILIRDNDTAFLHPFINRQVEDIVAKHGDRFDLFSCLTNRLGLAHQLPYGLSPEPNVLHHRKLAEQHFAKHYDEVIPSSKPTAGLFMLFRKRTWLEHPFEPGLAEGDFVDFKFSNGLLQKGKRIGICRGIYLFHYYRMHQTNWREHKHLQVDA
jgi:hypothetical protein